MYRLDQTIADVIRGIEDSVLIHGDWQGYTGDKVHETVKGEFEEFDQAHQRGQLHGEHGQIDELRDLAIVAIKGIIHLQRGPQ